MKVTSSLFFAFIAIASVTGLSTGQSQGQTQKDVEQVYLWNEVDEKLILKEKVKAKYTDEARKNCIYGYVVLRGTFRPSGKIESIEVVKGLGGGLNESSIKAMKKIKFRPAKKGGKEVSVSQLIEYDFNTIKQIHINDKVDACK
ncbi:MAG: energy transducer TonB [Blastocatellia bacterium]